MDRIREFRSRMYAIGRRVRGGTSLDREIPPEVRDDGLYAAIVRVAATPGVRHMLEIGSSSGAGSTEAFIEGALRNPQRPVLYCLELSEVRYEALKRRHAARPFVRCYHASSVPLESVASADQVADFYRSVPSTLNSYPLQTILRWRDQDVAYIAEHGLGLNGIRMIKEENGVDRFDAVLIDGSEFTGAAELDEVYGANYILLDDTRAFKNHANCARLADDPAYALIEVAEDVRNGYAVFALKPSN